MRSRMRITANFERNLDSIREFLSELGLPAGFDELLDHLFDDVIPNLERFPKMGRDFLANAPQSEEGRARQYALRVMMDSETQIREYITGEYLLLYAVRDSSVFLLSIRHHRQLSFDFRSHWH